jgi:hypothetical protein
VTPPGLDEDDEMRDQEAASILLLRVALQLLGVARLRGNFGEGKEINARAAEIADVLTADVPPTDPRRPAIQATVVRGDRIFLQASFDASSATAWSLMLDGTLYNGTTITGFGSAIPDPGAPSEGESVRLEPRGGGFRDRTARSRQFTASRFVRALAPPPQRRSETPVLAVLLYEDGLWVETTHDHAPREPSNLGGDAEWLLPIPDSARPAIRVTDDLGTEYLESGGRLGGGVKVQHSSQGFAPAPPPDARLLRVTIDDRSFEMELRP